MFLDKKCSIYSVSNSKVNWSTVRAKASIYSDIDCNFEVSKEPIYDTDLQRNSTELKYNVVIGRSNGLIRNNYIVNLIDDVFWDLWEFIISNIQSFKSALWDIDCITFTATETQWQL